MEMKVLPLSLWLLVLFPKSGYRSFSIQNYQLQNGFWYSLKWKGVIHLSNAFEVPNVIVKCLLKKLKRPKGRKIMGQRVQLVCFPKFADPLVAPKPDSCKYLSPFQFPKPNMGALIALRWWYVLNCKIPNYSGIWPQRNQVLSELPAGLVSISLCLRLSCFLFCAPYYLTDLCGAKCRGCCDEKFST